MNYFAHARRFLDDAYFAAGTAIPDWLNVLDRRIKARTPSAAKLLQDDDPCVVSLCRGIIQHHFDDRWFHQTEAFVMLNSQLAKQIRAILPDDTSMRPSFLAHVVIELILDNELIYRQPDRLKTYYNVLESLDENLIERTVSRMSSRPADRLGWLIKRFTAERFLYDYDSDDKLLVRLNQVMRRVGLEPLTERLLDWLGTSRVIVRGSIDELLCDESNQPAWQLPM